MTNGTDEPSGDADGLAVSAIDVRRAPGFERDGFSVDGFSPGVTVVHGPNGAGKSTLGRALQWLLWPRAAPPHAHVVGQFSFDGDDWRVAVDAGDGTYQRNGNPATQLSIPPVEDRDRYVLALHDLLQHDTRNADFAATIKQEAAGGYDLDAAHDALDYDGTPSTRGKSVVGDAEHAIERWRTAQREADDLRDDERRLDALRRDLDDAEAAADRVEALDLALEYVDAREALADAEATVESFPDEQAAIDGDEYERLQDLEERIDAAERGRDAAIEDRETADERLADAALPDDGLPPGCIERLREQTDRLETLEDRQAQKRAELENALGRRENAREDVPFDVDTDALVALDPGAAWPTIGDFAKQAETVQADRTMAQAIERWLGTDSTAGDDSSAGTDSTAGDDGSVPQADATARAADASAPAADATARAADASPSEAAPSTQGGDVGGPSVDESTLERGRRALENWLANPPADATGTGARGDTAFRIAAVSAVVIAIAAGALGVLVHPAGWVGVLVAALVLLWGFRARREADGDGDAADGQRATYRETFEDLPLDAPLSWSDAAVRTRLRALYDALAARRLAAEREQRRETFTSQLDDLAAHERELADLREAVESHLGGAPPDADVELAATIQAIGRWQTAHDDVTGLRTELEDLESQQSTVRADLEDALAPYGYDAVPDAATASGYVEDLGDRQRAHDRATETIEGATRTIDAKTDALASLREKRDAIYESVDLRPGADDRLRELCEQADAYAAAVDEYENADWSAERALEDLREHPASDPELADASRETLREMRADAADRAVDVDSLQREITEIEKDVRDAKRSTALEDARAETERALDALDAEYDADVAALVGDVLVDHVADATRESGRPAVFEHASELLTRITHGRYRLAFDETESDDAAFRAVDTVTDHGLALDELSSGTQLQVLLAVRVAFVERQERGPKLPLVLDETLANTDDDRAAVIVESMLELARDGRQIVYFTAQGDEVAKWQSALADAADVDHAVVDLAAERDLDRSVPVPALDAVTTHERSPPDPTGHDHESYGDAIDPPAFDPRRGASATHLWYVVDDVDHLHDLLDLGVEHWGQLDTLLDTSHRDVLVDDPEVLPAIERRGRAVEAFVRAWHVGRGDPVDRQALEATDAVSERFIDDVTALARDCKGDAERILEGLRDGEVDRFRSGKVDELESYFEANGYIDPADPLDPAALRVRVVDALTTDDRPRAAARTEAKALFERFDS